MKNETKLWIMLGLGITLLLITLSSCSSTKYYTTRGSVPNIHTPTKREIRKAMSYSTWEYNSITSSKYMNNNTINNTHWK
jgi:hypothetical protein